MKFVADENIDLPIIERLKNENHQVLSVYEMMRGLSDEEVLNIANNENAILLTIDKDFGELVFRRGMISGGVILIRLAGLTNNEKANIVAAAIKNHGDEMHSAFTVITHETIRIRRFDV